MEATTINSTITHERTQMTLCKEEMHPSGMTYMYMCPTCASAKVTTKIGDFICKGWGSRPVKGVIK